MFDEPLPQQGIAAEDLLKEIQEKVLPNSVHVNHPGYFGLITPTPTPAAIVWRFVAVHEKWLRLVAASDLTTTPAQPDGTLHAKVFDYAATGSCGFDASVTGPNLQMELCHGILLH